MTLIVVSLKVDFITFNKNPEKNRLVVLNRAQIEKRKPTYASAEFWGGEKDEWNNGKKTGKKEVVVGWEEEMFMKTLKRHCWDKVNIDSQKIDDFLMRTLENESQSNDREVQELIETNANIREITVDEDGVIVEDETPALEEAKASAEMPDMFAEAEKVKGKAKPGF